MGARKPSGSASISQLPEDLLKQPNTTLILNIQNNYNRGNTDNSSRSKQAINGMANIQYRKDPVSLSQQRKSYLSKYQKDLLEQRSHSKFSFNLQSAQAQGNHFR